MPPECLPLPGGDKRPANRWDCKSQAETGSVLKHTGAPAAVSDAELHSAALRAARLHHLPSDTIFLPRLLCYHWLMTDI